MSERERRFQLWGWGLFVLSAVFFIIAGLESASLSTLIGSVIFLVACLVFLVPLLWP